MRSTSDILVTAGIFAKCLDIRDVQVGLDKLLDKRHDSEGRPWVRAKLTRRDHAYTGSTKSVMTPTSSSVPGRTYAVMSNWKTCQPCRREKVVDSYLNLSEDDRIIGLIFLCNSLGAKKTPFLCRVPGRNVRSFFFPRNLRRTSGTRHRLRAQSRPKAKLCMLQGLSQCQTPNSSSTMLGNRENMHRTSSSAPGAGRNGQRLVLLRRNMSGCCR